MSEVFFEKPNLLQRHYPAVYAQMRLYYRQDPVTRSPSRKAARAHTRKKCSLF